MKTVLNILALVIAVALTVPVMADAVLWYDVQSSATATTHLYTYDLSTGVTADQGAVPGLSLMTGLTYDSGGQLYGVGLNNTSGTGKGNLYSITPGSPNSYSSIQINAGGISGSPEGLISYNNALFVSTRDQQFYELTPANGNSGHYTVAAQGSMGYGAAGSMVVGAGGQLYTTVTNGSIVQLATIDFNPSDANFGKATLVGGQIAPSGYNVNLAYVNGNLYAAITNGYANSELAIINSTTGAATNLTAMNGAVWGLAEVETGGLASPTPEPATMSLLGFGLAGMIFVRRRVK